MLSFFNFLTPWFAPENTSKILNPSVTNYMLNMSDISILNLVLIRLTLLNWYSVKSSKVWIYEIFLWKNGFYDVIKWRHNFFDTSKVSLVIRHNRARFHADWKGHLGFIASKSVFTIPSYLYYIHENPSLFYYSINPTV